MTAYYNEFDLKAAAWLKQLIEDGLIAPGDVDTRSIEDVKPDDLRHYKQCHFFAGIGVWSYALRQAGWDDNREVWTGSCPCQPFSSAGKGKGFADERHLWPAFHWLIQQCRPSTIFGEQVASKDGCGWIDIVQTDLENTDYTARAFDLCAAGIGKPHVRQRLFWLADSTMPRFQTQAEQRNNSTFAKIATTQPAHSGLASESAEWAYFADGKRRILQPGIFPLVDGSTAGMVYSSNQSSQEIRPNETAEAKTMRLKGYGNAIVAPLAKVFIESYMDTVDI